MGIEAAINRAFATAKSRRWNKIYFAIDLHETCLVSNYGKGNYSWINEAAVNALKSISDRRDCCIILWSSVHAEEEADIIAFFAASGVNVSYFNHNPEVANTAHGNFDTKFYFNVLVDDKAGFDYRTDWDDLRFALLTNDVLPNCHLCDDTGISDEDVSSQGGPDLGEPCFCPIGRSKV